MADWGLLRVCSFNVNGLRATLRRKFGTVKGLLQDLNADILCIQETKLRRSELDRELAVVEGWDSFFAFSQSARGYSGVATYVRSSLALPHAAEVGFTGCGSAQPSQACGASIHPALAEHFTVEELQELDGEGRVVVTDHGAFVLFNVYGPALTSEEALEERLAFKLKFYQALQRRWEDYLQRGRAVVVVGDLNICPAPIDSCDPEPNFYRPTRPDRLWLRALLQGAAVAAKRPGAGAHAEAATAAEAGARQAAEAAVASAPGDAEQAGDPQSWAGAAQPLAEDAALGAGALRSAGASSVAGQFVDVFRAFHPRRKHAFSCWRTATAARLNNYGSRIDLVLAAGIGVGAVLAGGGAGTGLGGCQQGQKQQPQEEEEEEDNSLQPSGLGAAEPSQPGDGVGRGQLTSHPHHHYQQQQQQPSAVHQDQRQPTATHHKQPQAAAAHKWQPQPQPTPHPHPHQHPHSQPQQRQGAQQPRQAGGGSGGSSSSSSIWFSGCDIMAAMEGSDHAPVWADLCYRGRFPCAASAPPCASRHLYSGKQMQLHGWLSMGRGPAQQAQQDSREQSSSAAAASSADVAALRGSQGAGMSACSAPPGMQSQAQQPQQAGGGKAAGMRAGRQDGGSGGGPGKKQASLKGFLSLNASSSTQQQAAAVASASAAAVGPALGPPVAGRKSVVQLHGAAVIMGSQDGSGGSGAGDPASARACATQSRCSGAADVAQHSGDSGPVSTAAAADAWRRIHQRMEMPKCYHGEPAALKLVNKSGPNKGRYFYVCRRPDGPKPEGQCNFFQWVKKRQGDNPGSSLGGGKGAGGTKRSKGAV